jgi:hypothetical protein
MNVVIGPSTMTMTVDNSLTSLVGMEAWMAPHWQ